MTIIIFILILAILILIHELGHFIMAKKNDILVEEFGFGFPPRLWSKKSGETIYSINLLPVGGFVKLFGEEYQEIEPGRLRSKAGKPLRLNITKAFVSKKPWQKTLVILGGVLMNIFLAVFIYYVLLAGNNFQSEPLPLFNNYQFRFGQQQGRTVVTNVVKNSPAYLAGVKDQDIIARMKIFNGQWIEINSGRQMIDTIGRLTNIPILIEMVNLKNNQKKQLLIKPIYDNKLNRSIIGVQLIDSVIIKYDRPLEKLLSGFFHSYNILIYNIKTFAYLFKSAYQ